jgi:hypothetical protein
MALQSQCPNCSKVLNLKSKAALGKRVPCPKCKKPFTVEPYEEEEYYEEEYYEDEYEDEGYEEEGYEEEGYDSYDDGEDDGYDEPPRRSRGGKGRGASAGKGRGASAGKGRGASAGKGRGASAGKGRGASAGRGKSGGKKSRAKPGGMPAWAKGLLAGGGGALVLALLIWGIISMMGGGFGGSGGSGKFNFAYLPTKADAVLTIKPAALWNAQLLAPIRNHPMVAAGMQQVTTQVPFAIDDVESIVMVFPSFPIGGIGDSDAIGVARFKKDIVIPSGLAQPADHKGTAYFDMGDGNAGWQPEPNVIVFGTKQLVTAAIDRGKGETASPSRFNFANADHQIVFSYAPENGLDLFEALRAFNIIVEQPPNTDGKINGIAMGLSLHSGVDIEVDISGKSSSQASLNAKAIQELITKGKQQVEFYLGMMPPEYQGIVESTVDSVGVDTNESLITVKIAVPGSLSDLIAKGVNELGNLGGLIPGFPGFPGDGPPGGNQGGGLESQGLGQ